MRHAKLFALMIPFLSPAVIVADSPFTKPDGTWVNLSGTAIETDANGFVTGNMEKNIIDTMELEADTLVTLDEQA
ncbi:hypothetical protein [Methylophaga sp.]|uniref:hypothetical protein n=1 Tax=Methylophaga sp. TaxID=2024840 RepID=UPI0014008F0F|nr:hypothetical protein [Methylophaga sp.]MTI63802.1 hypothetical protein [Methylophaga sp.]